MTTDGHKISLEAIETSFGGEVDYAMLIKLYANNGGSEDMAARNYSPAECTEIKVAPVSGKPDLEHVSTSYVERQNLTISLSMRRFTRLTNAFSKKMGNLDAAVALHFMYYKFGRIHKTLRVTPAMEAGIAGHVWTLEEIANLLN
ncbi:MAG: hypothetical protein PHD01_01990 [Geobacteraceae bacterium]|nr:hypothetical protein [Geobacteraceae bacterium]